MFEVNQKVKCINIDILKGNEIAPKLELGKEYTIETLVLDSKGNQHLDVGLVSDLNWVTSYETGEKLPKGDLIHWCHPSRFEVVI